MKKGTGKNIIIVVLILIVVALIARYVVFKERFNEWSQWLENIQQRQDNYRAQNPDATDEEVDQAFRESIDALEQRKEDYKAQNPGATDEDVENAFRNARSGHNQ